MNYWRCMYHTSRSITNQRCTRQNRQRLNRFITLMKQTMEKKFNLTRTNAAQMLNVSTRTVDRYIRAGKLSYKRVANKILLSYDEVTKLQKDFSILHQEVNSEIISTKNNQNTGLETLIDNKFEKFFSVLGEKDRLVEDKNKIIFMLQQRLGELETKLSSMIALPEYNKEKQATLLEKQKLEIKINDLSKGFKKERSRNSLFIGVMIIIVAIFLIFSIQKTL